MKPTFKIASARKAETLKRRLAKGLTAAMLPWVFALPMVGSAGSPPSLDELRLGNFIYQPLTVSGNFQARFLEDRNHVTVIELAGGSYDRDATDGSFNAEPRAVVAQEFYLDHPDEYDFLMVFTTFEFDTGDAVAFHVGAQNPVQGIGQPVFDNTAFFGSEGKLQGYIDMAALTRYSTDPLDPEFDFALGVMAHEILHQWCCYVGFDDAGASSQALLGKDDAHWSFLLDSDASVMYGSDWRDNADGTFTAANTRTFYSPLDLYLAGLFGPEQVPPFELIENPAVDKTQLPQRGATISGTSRLVSVDDVIAIEGPRIPAAAQAQKEFRAAFILLTRPGIEVEAAQIAALNNFREGLLARFSALTGGQALMQVFPEARLDIGTGTPDPVDGGGIRPTSANLDEALAWLRGEQVVDGFWEDTAATRLRDTAVALATLSALDPLFSGGSAALGWLGGQQEASADYRARTADVFEAVGQGAAALRAELIASQNSDGGWGLGDRYDSVPLDTALAVQALAGHPEVPAADLAAAVGYLVAVQGTDGGWSNTPVGPSRTGVTAEVLKALKRTDESTPVAAALAFLASRQNADGGFGDSPSTAHDSARALEALMSFDALGQIDAGGAATYLSSRQTVVGSWEGSVYTTALVVTALRRFAFPNWSFTSGLIPDPALPRDGERVALTVEVTNTGNATAPAGIVRFFDGDPGSGGVPIGADIVVPTLAAQQSATLTALWDTFDGAGGHTLVAVVDPDGTLAELSEVDNRAELLIEVVPAPVEADLEVREADILVTPSQPNELPTALGVVVTLRNLGLTDALDVRVVLTVGEGADAVIVDEVTLTAPQRSSTPVNLSYLLETPGLTVLTVEVDPDGLIPEADETNNTAARSVSTIASVDLEALDAGIVLAGGAFLGNDATFGVTLRNRGTVDSPTTQVRYRVSDGTTVRELGINTIQPTAGETLEQSIVWRVDLLGDLTFTAELDPDDLVPETDETNNTGTRAFTATAVTNPNLTVDFQDLGFDPNPGLEGSPLILSVLVRNAGGTAATNVEVAFYDGDPAQGGTLFGDLVVIPNLDAGASLLASTTVVEVPDAADRLIFAVVDPSDQIAEFDETDNDAFNTLEILSLPDLALSVASLDLSPRFPRPGDPVTLTVTVTNLGEQAATDVLVRTFDGEPAIDGVPVGGDQLIPTIPGQGSGSAVFSWTFDGTGDLRPIVVFADPDDTVREQSESNNRADLDVAVQDGNFFLSRRYFSPDGDGVKDGTSFFFFLGAPTTVQVEVVDRRDQVVRHSQPFVNVSDGQFDWDGLDDRGPVVRDGDYVLRVVDTAGVSLGEATVTVDTNRSSLIEAVGTPFELFTNLTCELPSVSRLTLTGDEDTFFFDITSNSDPLFGRGIYKMASNGGDVRQIVPAFWSTQASLREMQVASDGSRVVFSLRGRILAGGSFESRQYVVNGDGTGLQQLDPAPGLGSGTGVFGFTEDGNTVLVNQSASLVAIDLTGFAPPLVIFSIDTSFGSFSAERSPDEKRMVIPVSGDFGRQLALVNLETLTSTFLPSVPFSFDNYEFSFSPDSSRLAVARRQSGDLRIFDRSGNLLQESPLPVELPPYPIEDGGGGGEFLTSGGQGLTVGGDAPAVGEAVGLPGGPSLFLTKVGVPQWGPSSTELAILVTQTTGFSAEWRQLLRYDLLTELFENVAWTLPSFFGLPSSYHVSTWDGSTWVERAVLHHGIYLEEQKVDLSDFLPDPDGELKVRIRQAGLEAAHVEHVSLLSSGERLLPTSAVRLDTGQEALLEVRHQDNVLFDLHEAEMEVGWPAWEPGGPFVLALGAREEVLSTRRVVPFTYPRTGAYRYTVGEEGPMVVDGLQTSADDLGSALFGVQTRPVTGHPSAKVFGWVKSDGIDLYGALDFTVDNTLDGDRDWASLEVETASGWQEMRVTAVDQTYGIAGFTRTAPVHHAHKYYEFRIPLAEVGASVGETLSLRFRAYGTAAGCEIPGRCDPEVFDGLNLLPFSGYDLWVPNERTLYYANFTSGRPATAILLDDDNEFRDLFEEWFNFRNEKFSPSGRRLLYQSSDHRNDPASACYQRGFTDDFSFQSLMNLTVDLRPRRSSASGGILLEGTAADLNFKSYRLDYSPASSPGEFNPIVPPAGQQVIDDRFTTWVPPGPGTYFVRLQVEDLAGNVKEAIKRVSSSDTPSITDIYREPADISPNGDGVQDETLIHYRVLAPVHLEFQFFNEIGDRVRTIERDHSTIGLTFDLPWDGRDDSGLPVPDGIYRMLVQNFEFFVNVDSTPPEVMISLSDALQARTIEGLSSPVVVAAPELRYSVREANFATSLGESGFGETPFEWLEFPTSLRRSRTDPDLLLGGRPLDLDQFTHHRFRFEAQDRAGNRSLVTTPLGAEELIVSQFGVHAVTDFGTFADLELVPFLGRPRIRLANGDVRFKVAETIAEEIFQLSVQFRPEGQTNWSETVLDRFLPPGGVSFVSEIPQPELGAVWDMVGVPIGIETEIRLRAVDVLAQEHVSNSFFVLTDGIIFGGPLAQPDLTTGPYADLLSSLYETALNAGLLSPEDVILWGVEFVGAQLDEVILQISSSEDPRYAVPVPLEPLISVEGGFLFALDPATACLSYEGFILATTAPEPTIRTITSNGGGFTLRCLEIETELQPPTYGGCDEAPSSSMRTIDATPVSLNGAALVLLTLERTLPDGTPDILANINDPVSRRKYSFDFDTSGLPEGLETLTARLSNGEGESFTTSIRVAVDRTPPVPAINVPLEGQRLCGIQRLVEGEIRNVFDVEGLVSDNIGFSYRMEVEVPGSPPVFHALRDDREACYGPPNEVLFSSPYPADQCGSVQGPLGTWGDSDGETEFSGDTAVRIHAFDRGGYHVCQERQFFFDGEVEGAQTTISPRLFSPNGDENLDLTVLNIFLEEPASVDVEVYAAVETDRGPEISGDVLRFLETGLQVLDSALVNWDGQDGSGSVLPDGVYGLVTRFLDSCGNLASRTVFVELDNTPPTAPILFPGPSDPLPMVIEILGTVQDRNIQAWTVDFGVGLDPDTWSRINLGAGEMDAEVLAVWNTNGLFGDFTLRLVALDEAGNRTETLVSVLLGNPTYLLTYFEILPRFFSPNGDGRRETASMRFGLDFPSFVTLTVETDTGTVLRTLLDGVALGSGAVVRPWDGRSDGGTLLPDDVYTVVVRAVLAANPGVTQEETLTVVLDKTPPTIDITSPSTGFITGSSAVVGSIEDLHLTEYIVELTDTPSAPVWNELASGTTSRVSTTFAILDDLAEADYALRIRAEDEGEIRVEQILPFTVDNTPPVVTFTEPLAGSIVGAVGGPVDLLGTVEEEHLETYRVEFGAGPAPDTWTTIVLGTSIPTTDRLGVWDVSAVADGLYILRLTAQDLAGLSAEVRTSVTVDNTPPTAIIDDPADGSFVTAPQPILGTADDANLAEYVLEVAPAGSQQFQELVKGTLPVIGGSLFSWAGLPPDGQYTLRLSVVDGAGNQAVVAAGITVDLTPPAAPINLVATVVNDQDAQLDWTASPEPDLAGYRVYRDGVQITPSLVVPNTYLDPALQEGPHTYTVTALDLAGNESDPSNPADVTVDTTPPTVRISVPSDGDTVSGLVDVTGTAYSADDFREYRLYATATATGARQLLRQSPVPVQADVLGQWNTLVLPEAAEFVLRLEGEDLTGNIGFHEVTVTIDNLPPGAPTGLTATPNGSDVDVAWNANTEPDLAGYILFRDGRIANSSGVVVGDLTPFILRTTTFLDLGLPDGTFTYEVHAIDTAGNLSDASQPADATIDTRAPHAVIDPPVDGTEFENNLFVLATTVDEDVAQVLFQFRAAGDPTWIDLGIDTELPWEVDFDPIALTFGDYQLQAVATDLGGRTDPAPTPVTVTFTDLTRPQPVVDLAARVVGGEVTLTWTANTDTDLAGYHVERTDSVGSLSRLTASPIPETTYLDVGLPDDTYTYQVISVDLVDNEGDPSAPAEALVYTPVLEQPLTPIQALTMELSGSGGADSAVGGEVTRPSGTVALPAATSDAEGLFSLIGLPLERGLNTLAVRLTDAAGNVSKDASVSVISGSAPSPPTGLVAVAPTSTQVELSWNANPEPNIAGYRPFRDGEAVLPDSTITGVSATASSQTHSGVAPSRAVDGNVGTYWAPRVIAGFQPLAGQWLELSWASPLIVSQVNITWFSFESGGSLTNYGALDYDIEAWDGSAWIPLVRIRGNDQVVNQIDLPQPYRTDRLRVVLLAGLVAENFSQSLRVAEISLAQQVLVTGTSYTDPVGDGDYVYTVTAVNDLAFESGPSNPASVAVGDVDPPAPVVLTAVAAGSDVTLTWTASSSPDVTSYEIFRDGEPIALHTDLLALTHVDLNLLNGDYAYTVTAIDAVGNSSVPSNQEVVTVFVAPPPTPVNLTVTAVPGGGALDLAWAPQTGSTPLGYRIYRSLVTGGPYEEIAVTADTFLRDEGLVNGVTYFYVVGALDALGNESAFSNEDSGTPVDEQAPQPPVLHFPGFPGVLFVTATEPVDLAGTSEASAIVSLSRDGVPIGQTTATADLEVVATSFFEDVVVSPDGRYLWVSDFFGPILHDYRTSSDTFVTGARGQARWFADGSAVALADGGQITRYQVSDGTLDILATLGFAQMAVPSPDGTRLAVLGEQFFDPGLWIYDIPTATWTQLLDDPYWWFDEQTLNWSPDGSQLAYRRGTPVSAFEFVDVASGSITVVNSLPGVGGPSWSPDGGSLVYSATHPTLGGDRIRSYSLADGTETELTSGADDFFPQLSPDGRQLVWINDFSEAKLLDLASGQITSLEPVAGLGSYEQPQWSKSGRLLLWNFDDEVRLTFPGHFELSNVSLQGGDNAFTAIAEDPAGNVGARSLPMVVTLATADRPDLVLTASDVVISPPVGLIGQTVRVTVTVRNESENAAPPADLSVVVLGPGGFNRTLVSGEVLGAIPAGGSQSVTRDLVLGSETGIYSITAAVDPFDRLAEISEDNNLAQTDLPVAADGAPLLSVTTDRAVYFGDDDVLASLEVINAGTAFDGRLEVRIEDAAGFLVEELAATDIVDLGFGATLAETRTWNTGTIFAGDYRVTAQVKDSAGTVVAEALAPFIIGSAIGLDSQVTTDRGTYAVGSSVGIAGTIDYVSGNDTLSGAMATLQVLDGADTVLAQFNRPLGDLLPGDSVTVSADWPSAGNPPGTYRVQLLVEAGGAVQSTSEAFFDLQVGAVQLAGDLVLSDRNPGIGEVLSAAFTVDNLGGTGLTQVPLLIHLEDPVQGVILSTQSVLVDLPAGGQVTGVVSFGTTGLRLQSYLITLQAEIPAAGGGTQIVSLRTTSFTTADQGPPQVTIVRPVEGGLLGQDQIAQVVAFDDLTLIRIVEVQADGGAWQQIQLADAAGNRYDGQLALAEGVHTLVARATDSSGNTARSVPVTFTVDLTAPVVTITGVTDGQDSNDPLTPVIEIVEANPDFESITLNGTPFASGTAVDVAGAYVLQVTVEDAAGNRTEVTLSFTLTAALVIGDLSVTEGDAAAVDAVLPLSLSLPTAAGASATFATAAGTATADVDYTETTGTVSFAAGETAATLAVPVLGDLLDELDETFTVTLADGVDLVLADPEATVTIVDDDAVPDLVVDDVSVLETDAGTVDAVFTVTLSAASGLDVSLDFATSDTGATAGADYTAAAGTLTISAGTTTATISVAILDDALDEADETFALTLANVVNATVTDGEGQGTILDDDPAPDLSIGDATVTEGDTGTLDAVFTVTLSAASGLDVSFDYATADGTATAGADYTASSGTVTVLAGDTTATVAIAVLGDLLDEADETFTLTLINAVNGNIVDGEGLGTIVDNDPAPDLAIGDVTVTEGDVGTVNADFLVTLSAPSGQDITFTATTVDGTATAGLDYTASAAPVTMPAGTTSAIVTVAVLGDLQDEPDETFTVSLSAVVNAVAVDGVGLGTIVNDDFGPVFCPRDPGYWKRHVEDWPVQQLLLGGVVYDQPGLLALLRSGGSDAATKLARQLVATQLNLASGSDRVIQPVVDEADDFLALFPPGSRPRCQDKALAEALKDELEIYNDGDCDDGDSDSDGDSGGDSDEDSGGDDLGGGQQESGDDDSDSDDDDEDCRAISIADTRVIEGDDGDVEAQFTVTLSESRDSALTVDFVTLEGSATADEDYETTSGFLTIPKHETTGTVRIKVYGDLLPEEDETFVVELRNPQEGFILRGIGEAVIEDQDDCASPNLLSNPGAEEALADGEIPGWTEVLGSSWLPAAAQPDPESGDSYFYAGENAAAELAQGVDVSAWEAAIDGGEVTFAFRGFVRTWDESPTDTARIVVEFRDAGDTVVLEAYDSGALVSPNEWLEVADERTPPPGTGHIHVRLISTRGADDGSENGGSNDGFFDSLTLVSRGVAVLTASDAVGDEPRPGELGEALFEVRLSCAGEFPVTVEFHTEDGLAEAGADYTAITAGSAVLEAGEHRILIPVEVLGDDEEEGEEDFLLVVDSVDGALQLSTEARGLIVEASVFCPEDRKYWRDHEEEWPAQELTLGGVFYDAQGLDDFLHYSGGDAASKLARELVATLFNLLRGSDSLIEGVVADADDFLVDFPPGSKPKGSDKRQADRLRKDLEDYNKGKDVPCDDGDPDDDEDSATSGGEAEASRSGGDGGGDEGDPGSALGSMTAVTRNEEIAP